MDNQNNKGNGPDNNRRLGDHLATTLLITLLSWGFILLCRDPAGRDQL